MRASRALRVAGISAPRRVLSGRAAIGPGHPAYNIPQTGGKPDTPIPPPTPNSIFIAPIMKTNWGKFKALFHHYPSILHFLHSFCIFD
jgi:hypothetical protein